MPIRFTFLSIAIVAGIVCVSGCQTKPKDDDQNPSAEQSDKHVDEQQIQIPQTNRHQPTEDAVTRVEYDDVNGALAAADSGGLIRLLESDPSYLVKNYFGAGTLLHEAAYRNMPQAIRYMVSAGVDVNIEGRLRDSAVHQAVEGRHWEAVELLLKLGAKIDWGSGTQPTPLFTAVMAQNVELAEKLIAAGADPNATYVNMRGEQRRPLDFAVLGQDEAMIDFLESHGATPAPDDKLPPTNTGDRNTARLTQYIDRGGVREAKTLIREYPDLVNDEGNTLLHLAAKAGLADLVEFGLKLNAEIDNQDTFGRTPLGVALKNEHLDIARALLQHGADPNVGAGKNPTAIFDAAWDDNAEAVELLLEYGADVNASFMHRAGFPRNALEAVSHGGREPMRKLLLKHGAKMPDIAQMATKNKAQAASIGELALQSGNYDSAVKALTVAIQHQPTAELFYQRGVARDMLEQLDQALADFNQAIQLDEQSFQALYSRSLVNRKLKRWADVKADLESAVKLNGQDFSVVTALADLLATAPDESMRDVKRAVQLATRACELTEWDDPICIRTLANAHKQNGDATKAEEMSAKANQVRQANISREIIDYVESVSFSDVLPNGLQEIVPNDPSIAVWTQPSDSNDSTLLFTTGLSQYQLMQPEAGNEDQSYVRFAELCLKVPSDWPKQPDLKDPQAWPWLYLRSLAKEIYSSKVAVTRFPILYPSTLPEEPLAPGSEFHSVILAPEFGAVSGFTAPDGRQIQMITIVPIYPEEHKLAATKGIRELVGLFDKLEIESELTPGRVNAGAPQ